MTRDLWQTKNGRDGRPSKSNINQGRACRDMTSQNKREREEGGRVRASENEVNEGEVR